ncbi:Ubiquitin carboxyl-terminal hydrolase 13 [Vitis vinifera]|uniref:ubiquitinyl hydrolase 1 n=1 Tax=Vitis vinifera TaxID=29760 RepID=A0A438IIB9_VITVI|nr:Ubiquitin carboxyl-terminal hydrolase 13 [Vitis vinifera]
MLWVSLQVGQLREASTKVNNAELKLFLEVELGPLTPYNTSGSASYSSTEKTKEDILLFFKLYDPEKEELRYVGRLFVKSSGKPIEILTKLNEMAGFAPDEEIELYEEIKFEPCVMCEHLAKRTSFRFSQIEDGDIICFQKSAPPESEEQCRYSDVTSFLEYVQNRQLDSRDKKNTVIDGGFAVVIILVGCGACWVGDGIFVLWWNEGGFSLLRGTYIWKGPRVRFRAYLLDSPWSLLFLGPTERSTTWPPIGSTLQAFLGLGWGGGKILEKTDYMKEMILIKKRKANTNKKYFLSSPKWVSIGDHSSSMLDFVKCLGSKLCIFRALERPKEDDFCLELSKLHNYDDVVERVARRLGLDDPSKIRLTSHNCYSQQPKPQPIKYRGVEHLSDMLVHYNQSSDILYYEVLDIPLPELQGLKNLKVAFHHATKDDVIIHNIRLPKQSTVGDVINELKTKVELSHPNAELRLLEVSITRFISDPSPECCFLHLCHMIHIFPPSEKIENIMTNTGHSVQRRQVSFCPYIPEEEKNLGPHDRLIHVYHFTKETVQNQMQVQNFGEPFFLIIHEGETLAEVKERIQKKLQVPDEEFSKVSLCPSSLLQYAAAVTNHEHTLTHTWKLLFYHWVVQSTCRILTLCPAVFSLNVLVYFVQRRDVYGAWEQYLGLEHSDTAPKRAYAANQNATHLRAG